MPVSFYFTARRLNEYIRHYEPLSYPTEEVHRGHLRAKRSVTRDNSVTLKFRSHGRDFHIRLKRDLATFSNNLIIEGPSGQTEDLDTSHIYQGHLVGELCFDQLFCMCLYNLAPFNHGGWIILSKFKFSNRRLLKVNGFDYNMKQ